MTYFPVHAHSLFSGMDGMHEVESMVQKVALLGQPAIALTDHGNMAGAVRLYKEAKKNDLLAFPGEEFYLVRDVHDDKTKGTRYHVGMMALTEDGYETLVKLSTKSWGPDRFYYKPLIDFADLSALSKFDGIAVTSGCYSSLPVQTLIEHGPQRMEAVLKMFAHWFPNFYVELQDHGIDWGDGWTDSMIADALYAAACNLGLPVVMGADSHYIDPAEQPVHDLMKDICYFGAGEDVHFNGGPYHLLSDSEASAKFDPTVWSDIMDGHADLLDKHALKIGPLDNYKFQVPRMFKNADDRLRTLCEQGLDDLGITGQAHWDRLDEELTVIEKMGMANYFLLVKEHLTDWCRAHDVIVNTRGSANGSLVCYALRITTVDPLRWNTSFERFLSLQRMKPPDIDIDVSFRGRERLISHVRSVFPTMSAVGTYQRIGFSRAKDETGDVMDDDAKGSIMVQYMAAMRKKDPKFDGKVKKHHWDPLNALANIPVYKAMGKNAAGFLLPGDDHPIDKYLPQARIISSDSVVTQMTKDDVEALGYLKVDILGLRALETLNGTLDLIGKPRNEWDWIPFDDKMACYLIRKGYTKGVFQYEGFTNRKGAMEMKVMNTFDCILGIALYRPALINGGQKDQYLANRGRPKSQQVRLHSLFDMVLEDTDGVPLYQEQVMEMLQAIGMQFVDYNDLMTAIKASNGFIANAAGTFKRLMPVFYDLCEASGLSPADTDDAWNAVIGFTEYGFNRAHSTSYGLMAYYSAYLKQHYPDQFMASLLSVWADDKDKTREYTSDARRMGYSIIKPDVNYSVDGWVLDPSRPKALRKGFLTIPGIKYKASDAIMEARKAGPFTSIQDFIDRTPSQPITGGKDWKTKGELTGVCRALYDANAFRSVNNT